MNCHQFLQIIQVNLINDERSSKTNAMLDTRLDSMLIITGIAKQLCLKGIDLEISLFNVVSSKRTFQCNLGISQRRHFFDLNFENFKIRNALVVNSMNRPPKCLR